MSETNELLLKQEYIDILPKRLTECGLYNGSYNEYPKPNEKEIIACMAWIALFCQKRKTINKNSGSYNLKHRVENWTGFYISNGALIASFIILGYNYRRADEGSPNAFFNFKYIGPKIKHCHDMPYSTEEWRALGCDFPL
jgi:hypothetical protein